MLASGHELNLPKREEKILEFWERNEIFEKTLVKTKRKKPFIFYEGPPYANGRPGIHHFEARVFKDIIIRYRTMRGFFVPRKAGWDTHGLPIEMEVEKKLGVKSKKEIEDKIGIERFVQEARANVFFYKEEWEKFTKRIAYWLDLANAYMTMSTEYIETLWWIIKKIWKKKLLYQDFKVVPWCPRCQTGLSTHELGQGYETVTDTSLFAKFELGHNEYVLSWTTTPWTLPGNVALAINPKLEYIRVHVHLRHGDEAWIVAKNRLSIIPEDIRRGRIESVSPRDLIGRKYKPLFQIPSLKNEHAHRIYPADFVSAEEGTGVVHTAVMYGEDDYRLGKNVGLPTVHTVDETGHFTSEVGGKLAGRYVKDQETENIIIASLRERNFLAIPPKLHKHEYPHCWRCETPLLYYARNAWWVKVSAKRKDLLVNNEKINWVPEHIKHGRFGEFLKEARDWAFSRERYWGTPLPIWQCEHCEAAEVVGSLRELDLLDPAPTRLILMRHGEALHNVKNMMNPVAPANDRKNVLTEQGRHEAAAASRRLKPERIDAIVSSPSYRARETAKIVGQTIGISRIDVLPDLSDIKIGGFEGHSVSEFRASFADFSERFVKKPKGAENLRELRTRMMRAVSIIHQQYRGKRVLVVSHGDPMWVLMAALEGVAESDYKKSPYLAPGEWREMRLHNWPYDAGGEVNLHRPYIDAVLLTCRRCQGAMRRVSEVADVWFDSGSMPFAQHHFPFAFEKIRNPEPGTRNLPFPADYICEAVDQTRGWFYTLLAVSTLLGRGPSYKNVISLGHVLDKHGQKMSKSKGNIVDPWAMIKKYGTDTIRWYFYTINAPGDPKRFDEKDLLLKLRGPISTLWNSFVFFNTYVNKLSAIRYPLTPRHVLDHWVLAKLNELTSEVTRRLDRYDIVGAARALDAFIVEDFSNWYLRRSRRRFQKPENRKEKNEAAAVTAYALLRLGELMAPFTPFLAEIIYQELKKKRGLKEESVHLREWPITKFKIQNSKFKILSVGMAEVRRLAALALAERAKAGIRVRQPLQKFKIQNSKFKIPAGLIDVLKEEVNVKEVVFDSSIKSEIELDTAITPELREEGLIREFVRNIQEMRRDAGLKPRQGIMVQVIGNRVATAAIERWKKFIQKEAGVRTLQFGGKRSFTVERGVKLDGGKVWVGIKRV